MIDAWAFNDVSFFLTNNYLYTCGNNSFGKLGIDIECKNILMPQKVILPYIYNINDLNDIKMSNTNTILSFVDLYLIAGSNKSCQISDNTEDYIDRFTIPDWPTMPTSISLEDDYALSIVEDNILMFIGDSEIKSVFNISEKLPLKNYNTFSIVKCYKEDIPFENKKYEIKTNTDGFILKEFSKISDYNYAMNGYSINDYIATSLIIFNNKINKFFNKENNLVLDKGNVVYNPLPGIEYDTLFDNNLNFNLSFITGKKLSVFSSMPDRYIYDIKDFEVLNDKLIVYGISNRGDTCLSLLGNFKNNNKVSNSHLFSRLIKIHNCDLAINNIFTYKNNFYINFTQRNAEKSLTIHQINDIDDISINIINETVINNNDIFKDTYKNTAQWINKELHLTIGDMYGLELNTFNNSNIRINSSDFETVKIKGKDGDNNRIFLVAKKEGKATINCFNENNDILDSCAVCVEQYSEPVRFLKNSYVLFDNEVIDIEAINAKDGTNFKSSNPDIFIVDSNKILAKNQGSASLFAYENDKLVAFIPIYIIGDAVIKYLQKNISIKVGEKYVLDIPDLLLPEISMEPKEQLCYIEDNKIVALSEGLDSVHITIKDSLSFDIDVDIEKSEDESISFINKSINIYKGVKFFLPLYNNINNAEESNVFITSSNKSIVTVKKENNKYFINALGVGHAILLLSTNKNSSLLHVNVLDSEDNNEFHCPQSLVCDINTNSHLFCFFNSKFLNKNEIVYKSLNENICKIDSNGNYTATGVGITKILAKTPFLTKEIYFMVLNNIEKNQTTESQMDIISTYISNKNKYIDISGLNTYGELIIIKEGIIDLKTLIKNIDIENVMCKVETNLNTLEVNNNKITAIKPGNSSIKLIDRLGKLGSLNIPVKVIKPSDIRFETFSFNINKPDNPPIIKEEAEYIIDCHSYFNLKFNNPSVLNMFNNYKDNEPLDEQFFIFYDREKVRYLGNLNFKSISPGNTDIRIYLSDKKTLIHQVNLYTNYYEGYYTEKFNGIRLKTNQTIKLKFNIAISQTRITDDSVFIQSANSINGPRLNIDLDISKDKKTLYITPIEEIKPGRYNLCLTNDLKNILDLSLTTPTKIGITYE